ncbi:MAG: alpha/beta hydrolase [Planctomycetota bacterium]|nr:alpha/beta hydrolase [Planctomycetota bacterium]
MTCTSCMSEPASTQQMAATSKPTLMTPADLQSLPMQPPDHVLPYGDDVNQVGELRIPRQPGPHPVVVLIHGGCWKAEYATRRDLAPMGDTLRADGVASWNVEYRRLGQPGGGWPGTYLDVGRAIDHLRTLAATHDLNLGKVVLVGHSAGGHLAMWAGTRQRIAQTSALFVPMPLPIKGVINLAGTIDMTENIARMEGECRDAVVSGMLGGTPAAVPDRYREVSAGTMLPLGVPQVLVWGEHENFVPLALAQRHAAAASQAGDRAGVIVVPAVGHFETASPASTAWPTVLGAIRSLLRD